MYGVASVSFRDNSVEEIVEQVKKSGLKYIEWGSDIHAPKDDIEKLYAIKSLCAVHGILQARILEWVAGSHREDKEVTLELRL